jgi:NAD(P)-dependent dehydrogenase (short-subunit alcohol dehydrogenase family)
MTDSTPSTPRTALVTGGAFGLGAAICQHAARAGYRVAVLDLKLEDCEALLPKLAGTGHVALQADVTDEHQVHAAFEKLGVTLTSSSATLALSASGRSSSIPSMSSAKR